MDGDEVIETKNSNSDCRSSETTPPPRPIDVTEYIISLELKSVKFKKDEHGIILNVRRKLVDIRTKVWQL